VLARSHARTSLSSAPRQMKCMKREGGVRKVGNETEACTPNIAPKCTERSDVPGVGIVFYRFSSRAFTAVSGALRASDTAGNFSTRTMRRLELCTGTMTAGLDHGTVHSCDFPFDLYFVKPGNVIGSGRQWLEPDRRCGRVDILVRSLLFYY